MSLEMAGLKIGVAGLTVLLDAPGAEPYIEANRGGTGGAGRGLWPGL